MRRWVGVRGAVARALVVGVVLAGTVAGLATPGAAASSAKEIAQAGVLVQSDFPAGWTSSARGQTSDAAQLAAGAKIASCKPFVAFSTANKKNPRAKSPTFDHEQSDVTNTVSVYPSTAKAQAAIHQFGEGDLPTCLEKLFSSVYEQQLAKQPAVRKQLVSVNTTISPVADVHVGDEAVAYQGTIDVNLKTGTQTVGIGVVTARVGDALVGYSWTTDVDLSAALQPAIVQSVARLAKAQSAA